jgi:hypothetical protein
MKRDHGSVVFVAPGESGVTIAVRAVPIEGDWTDRRTPELVYPATEKVLRGLPEAIVREGSSVRTGSMEGMAYRVIFVPAGKRDRYERKHIVLVGTTYVYHLMLTGRAGRLGETEKLFEEVVGTLREEV